MTNVLEIVGRNRSREASTPATGAHQLYCSPPSLPNSRRRQMMPQWQQTSYTRFIRALNLSQLPCSASPQHELRSAPTRPLPIRSGTRFVPSHLVSSPRRNSPACSVLFPTTTKDPALPALLLASVLQRAAPQRTYIQTVHHLQPPPAPPHSL